MRRKYADRFAMGVVDGLSRICERGCSRIEAFTKYNRQVEGWFKGELLCMAAKMEMDGEVKSFHPDCRIDAASGKQNIDLMYNLGGGRRVWIELKHWFLGKYPGGNKWTAKRYCAGKTSGTPYNALKKVPTKWSEPVYMMIVMTPRPQMEDWNSGLAVLETKNPSLSIKSMTNPNNFTGSHFIGLLRLNADVPD